MDRLRISWICTFLFFCIGLSVAQQADRVVMRADTLQSGHLPGGPIMDNDPLTPDKGVLDPQMPESVSGEGTTLEEVPDSAAIMSQAEFLLEQMHAGTLLFPSYQMDNQDQRSHSQRKFSHGLIAGAQREDLVGLMGIERGMLGYGISYGPLSLQAYATADKYASFHNLTTVYGIGGSLTVDITDWMSVTAFGAYYNQAPYMGMASYPYINTSNYGGYMTFHGSGAFGMSMGMRRDYDPISRRYYTNPVVIPSVKIKNAIFSVDFGPVINEAFQIFNRPKMPSGPMMGPPGPRLLKPAGPLR